MESVLLVQALRDVMHKRAELILAEQAYDQAKAHARSWGATEEDIVATAELVERAAGRPA